MTFFGGQCPVCHQRKDIRGSCTHEFHLGFEGIFDTNALTNATCSVPDTHVQPTLDQMVQMIKELDREPILSKLRMHPCTLPAFREKVGISECAPIYASSFMQLPIHEDPSIPPGYIEFRGTKGNLMKLYKLDGDRLFEVLLPSKDTP